MDALELLTEHAQELRESFVPHVVLGNSTFGLTQYTFYIDLGMDHRGTHRVLGGQAPHPHPHQ